MITVDIQRETTAETPDDEILKRTVASTLSALPEPVTSAEVSLRIIDREEMRDLNARYRQRDCATNVLSFPADIPLELDVSFLGDIAICGPVVVDEATEQRKAVAAHWDHMLVHGVLHLLGHDHEDDEEARVMESLETRILADLGWPDPYREGGTPMEAVS